MEELRTKLANRSVVNDRTGCHEWIAGKTSKGYGAIRVNGSQQLAHRAAWELRNGPIPEGLQALHTCDNRACVNVDHLFLGTTADNMKDKTQKNRQARGESIASSKLDDAAIRMIRMDERPQRTIAVEYGVCQSTVGFIKRKETWAHVT